MVGLYLDGDLERMLDAAQTAGLLEPSNIAYLYQPLFLLEYGVEHPADHCYGRRPRKLN